MLRLDPTRESISVTTGNVLSSQKFPAAAAIFNCRADRTADHFAWFREGAPRRRQAVTLTSTVMPMQRVGFADEASGDRDGLPYVPGDRDRDQVCAADAAVRRIEGDPVCPRHIDLRPGMGRAGADSSEAGRTGVLEIPRDDPCPEPQAARSVGEEHRKVPARPPAAIERLEGRLRPLLLTVLVQDRIGDGRTEILQQGQRVGRRHAHDAAHPCGKSPVRVLILLDRQRSEIERKCRNGAPGETPARFAAPRTDTCSAPRSSMICTVAVIRDDTAWGGWFRPYPSFWSYLSIAWSPNVITDCFLAIELLAMGRSKLPHPGFRRIGPGESLRRDYQALERPGAQNAAIGARAFRQLVHLVGQMSKLPSTASNRRKSAPVEPFREAAWRSPSEHVEPADILGLGLSFDRGSVFCAGTAAALRLPGHHDDH